jgi:hypothetical protein
VNVRKRGKGSFLKRLADRDRHPFLLFLGIPPARLVEGSVQLKTEPAGRDRKIRRPDRVYRSGDGSILVIEFQSTADDIDLYRFPKYTFMLAVEHSERNKFVRSMSWSSILPASGSGNHNPTPTGYSRARVASASGPTGSSWRIFLT